MIVKTDCETDGALHSTSPGSHQVSRKYCVQSPSICAKLGPGRCLVFICVTDNCSDCQQRITIRGAPTQHFTISTLALATSGQTSPATSHSALGKYCPPQLSSELQIFRDLGSLSSPFMSLVWRARVVPRPSHYLLNIYIST